jgi:hypothetical protein
MELGPLVCFIAEVCVEWNLHLMFLNVEIFCTYGHACKASCMRSSVVSVLTSAHGLRCAWFYALSCVGSGAQKWAIALLIGPN